jgi:hypothetical protein
MRLESQVSARKIDAERHEPCDACGYISGMFAGVRPYRPPLAMVWRKRVDSALSLET